MPSKPGLTSLAKGPAELIARNFRAVCRAECHESGSLELEEGFCKPKPLFEDNLQILFHATRPRRAKPGATKTDSKLMFPLSSCSI